MEPNLPGRCVRGLVASLSVCALLGACASMAVAASPKAGVHPVILSEAKGTALLGGGTSEGKWLASTRIAPALKDGLRYKLYNASKCVGEATGSIPERQYAQSYVVKLTGSDTDFTIGVAADWNALPRIPRVQPTDSPACVREVRSILDSKGMKSVAVNITNVLRVDINGDGADETLISAQSKSYSPMYWGAGGYSMVLLCTSQATYQLKSEFHRASRKNSMPESYSISGLWDIDGDGALEIGVGFANQRADAAGIAFYDWNGKKPRLLSRMSMGH